MEEYIPNKTENLHDYLIPSIGDVPEIESILIEKEDPEGPYGARGLGEHVLIPTAPAILNAIRNATGAIITKLPALPHRIWKLLQRLKMQKSKLIEKIRCDACPIMCFIAEGKYGACDRYANKNGKIVRLDPLLILNNCINSGMKIKPFLNTEWNGEIIKEKDIFITAIGSGTTYPDYKPAPFIFNRNIDGNDFVTIVTEANFSYCGVK